MSELLESLRKFDALRSGEAGRDVVQRRVLDSVSPVYGSYGVVDQLNSRLKTALERNEIQRF